MPGPARVGGGRLSEPRCAAGSRPGPEGAAVSRGGAGDQGRVAPVGEPGASEAFAPGGATRTWAREGARGRRGPGGRSLEPRPRPEARRERGAGPPPPGLAPPTAPDLFPTQPSPPGRPSGNPGPRPSCLARLRELRQPGQRADRHPGHERLSDRHEETQGAAEAAQRRQSPVLSAGGSVPWGRPGLAQVTGGGRGAGTGGWGGDTGRTRRLP